MKRNATETYGLFAVLVEQSPPETRDQAALILTHARVQATIAANRRRELRDLWRVRGALLTIAFAVLVLLVGLVDAPGDHVGRDEINHVRAGRAVAELPSSTAEVAN